MINDNIIRYVLMTEKSLQLIESENKLIFIVKKDSNKSQIKEAIEDFFDSPVSSVNTLIDQKGRKKAFVQFKEAEAAGDIAMRLGII